MTGPSASRLGLAGMLALAIAIGVGRFAFTPILPMMMSDHGVTLRTAGLLAAVNYAGHLLGALSAIWLRLRIATIVRMALIGLVALSAAMGSTHEPTVSLLLRGLAGFSVPGFWYSLAPSSCSSSHSWEAGRWVA